MASRKALQGRGSRGATELGGGIAYTRFEEQDVESSQSSIGRPAGVGAARTGGGLAAGHGLTFVDDNEPEVVQVELPAEQFDNLPAVGAATGAAKGPWFDYVIVFDRDMLKSNKKQGLAHQQVFESIKQSLRKIKGIMLDEQESRFHTNPEHFLLVGGDEAFFQTYAEVLKIKKKLRHKIDGMEEMEFNRNHAHLFADPQEGQAFFNSRERIHMLQTLISQHPQRGGAGLSLGESREEGYVKEFFPLHDEQERVVLENRWIKSRDPFKFFQWLGYKKERVVYDAQGRAEKELYKPAFERLDMIRDYFGESIAMYFGFLEVYTLWLVFSALVGAGVFVAQATDRDDYLVVNPATGLTEVRAYNTYDGYVMPFYCIFLAISVSVFLEWWKRNQNMLAHRWEQTEQAEIERPEFKGHLTEGFWTKEEEWVSVPLRKEYTVIKKKYAKHFDWVYKAEFKDLGHRYHFLRKWYLVGYGAITTAVVIVLAAAMTLLALREWLYFNKGPQWASYIGGPSFAITIKVLDFVYYRVAKYITDREDHVWQSKYESSLISKVFLFQFVNNYIAYYYIAFVKNFGPSIFGGKPQQCLPVVGDGMAPPNCMFELNKQLASVFVVQIFVGNSIELALPFVKSLLPLWRENGKRKVTKERTFADADLTQIERQSNMPDYDGLFADYNEMIIQFGYVTLFASGFPLAAVLALLNNIVELRTDAVKFMRIQKRPGVSGAKDIGPWFGILDIMSNAAIVTNVLILCFVSTSVDEVFTKRGIPNPKFWKLFTLVAVEHVVFGIKWALRAFIPDHDDDVRRDVAMKEKMLEWAELTKPPPRIDLVKAGTVGKPAAAPISGAAQRIERFSLPPREGSDAAIALARAQALYSRPAAASPTLGEPEGRY
eukprot:tig00000053_g23503.t1